MILNTSRGSIISRFDNEAFRSLHSELQRDHTDRSAWQGGEKALWLLSVASALEYRSICIRVEHHAAVDTTKTAVIAPGAHKRETESCG